MIIKEAEEKVAQEVVAQASMMLSGGATVSTMVATPAPLLTREEATDSVMHDEQVLQVALAAVEG